LSIACEGRDRRVAHCHCSHPRSTYLLTWNCRQLANATIRPLIESVCASNRLKAPIICTPEELLETRS
jgi:hypothetical protein